MVDTPTNSAFFYEPSEGSGCFLDDSATSFTFHFQNSPGNDGIGRDSCSSPLKSIFWRHELSEVNSASSSKEHSSSFVKLFSYGKSNEISANFVDDNGATNLIGTEDNFQHDSDKSGGSYDFFSGGNSASSSSSRTFTQAKPILSGLSSSSLSDYHSYAHKQSISDLCNTFGSPAFGVSPALPSDLRLSSCGRYGKQPRQQSPEDSQKGSMQFDEQTEEIARLEEKLNKCMPRNAIRRTEDQRDNQDQNFIAAKSSKSGKDAGITDNSILDLEGLLTEFSVYDIIADDESLQKRANHSFRKMVEQGIEKRKSNNGLANKRKRRSGATATEDINERKSEE